jgi:hypothetical protein
MKIGKLQITESEKSRILGLYNLLKEDLESTSVESMDMNEYAPPKKGFLALIQELVTTNGVKLSKSAFLALPTNNPIKQTFNGVVEAAKKDNAFITVGGKQIDNGDDLFGALVHGSTMGRNSVGTVLQKGAETNQIRTWFLKSSKTPPILWESFSVDQIKQKWFFEKYRSFAGNYPKFKAQLVADGYPDAVAERLYANSTSKNLGGSSFAGRLAKEAETLGSNSSSIIDKFKKLFSKKKSGSKIPWKTLLFWGSLIGVTTAGLIYLVDTYSGDDYTEQEKKSTGGNTPLPSAPLRTCYAELIAQNPTNNYPEYDVSSGKSWLLTSDGVQYHWSSDSTTIEKIYPPDSSNVRKKEVCKCENGNVVPK